MPQSLAQIYLHIVFSTKDRKPLLTDTEFRGRTHAYLAGIVKNLDCPSLIVGGVEDHVHILCRLGKTIDVATLLRELKRDSSKWIKAEQPRLAEFHWQAGYGAFSISPSHVAALREYIQNQEQHHQRESFQDEFRRLCKKYGIEIDERYVWDSPGMVLLAVVKPLRGLDDATARDSQGALADSRPWAMMSNAFGVPRIPAS